MREVTRIRDRTSRLSHFNARIPSQTVLRPMSNSFRNKKCKILEQLNAPPDEYTDASPKGSIDEPIRDLVNEINALDDLVTTSSCSGRFAIYLEGPRKDTSHLQDEPAADRSETASTTATASSGGKGGGQWLFVTHSALDTIPSAQSMIGSSSGSINTIMCSDDAIPPHARLLHFKFEAMILHILTSSIDSAKRVLAAAQTAGFRESGISSVSGPAGREADMVMVAVRSTGLATDAPIGVSGWRGGRRSYGRVVGQRSVRAESGGNGE